MTLVPQSLTPHLYASQSRDYDMNSAVWLSEGQAALVDPGIHTDEIDDLVAWVKSRNAVINAVVLTHGDYDHVLGPRRIPGAQVIAHSAYPQKAADDFAFARKVIRAEGFLVEGEDYSAPQATRLVEHGGVLQLGALTLQFLHTPGHTPDHLSIWEPQEGVLCAGDILSDVELPYASHSLLEYARSLDVLTGLDVRVLVQGHGRWSSDPAEIRLRLARDRAYLAGIRALVERCLSEERSLEYCIGMSESWRTPYEGQERQHRMNVESAWLELGGIGDPTSIGWKAGKISFLDSN